MLESDLRDLGYIATYALGNVMRVCFRSDMKTRAEVDAWDASDNVDYVLPRLISGFRLLKEHGFKIDDMSFGVGFQPLPNDGGHVFAITATYTPDETGGWSIDDLIDPSPKTMWTKVTDELIQLIGSEF